MKKSKRKISVIIANRLLISVFTAFVITSVVMFILVYHNCEKQACELLGNTTSMMMDDLRISTDNFLVEDVVTVELAMYITGGEEAVTDYLEDSEYSCFARRDGTIFLSGNEDLIGKNIRDMEYASVAIDFLYEEDGVMNTFSNMSFPTKTLDGKTQVRYLYGYLPEEPDVILAAAFSDENYSKAVSYVATAKPFYHSVGINGFQTIVDVDGTVLGMTPWEAEDTSFPLPELLEKYENDEGRKTQEFDSEIMMGDAVVKQTDKVMCDRAVLWGADYYLGLSRVFDVYCLSLYPAEEVLYPAKNMIRYILIIEIVVFVVLFFVLHRLIMSTVVDKIRKVNTSLDRIAEGDLSGSVEVRDSYEFNLLSDDINATVDKLKEYIAEAAARIDADLFIAKSIQTSSLPSVFPPYPEHKEFELYASMEAAKEVGGDFYDFFMLGENTLGFLIADVSGKSIPGAMFMMTSKSIIKNYAESGLSPAEVFTKANEKLCEGNEAEMFVTAWLGYLNIKTGEVRVANAGHNPPVLIRNGVAEYVIVKPDLVLAGIEGMRYREQTLMLQKGDILYLYTDGVTEAMDAGDNQYGEGRLKDLLSFGENIPAPDDQYGMPGTICNMVSRDVAKFAAGVEQSDDITMLCIRYLQE